MKFRKNVASRLTDANPSNQKRYNSNHIRKDKAEKQTFLHNHGFEGLSYYNRVAICPTERGTENGNRPAGLKSPNKTSAMAIPPSCPG